MRVPSPISTQVSSPLNLRSCGSPPSTDPTPTRHARRQADVPLENRTWVEDAVIADLAAVSDDHARADLHIAAQRCVVRDDRGGMNAFHLSRSIADMSASATTLPSTFATPCILHIGPRICTTSSSKRSWSPGRTGFLHFTLSSDVK